MRYGITASGFCALLSNLMDMLTVRTRSLLGVLMLTLVVAAQTSINQSLTYFEHLSEPMAEFLFTLADAFDYPQLTEDVLKDISSKEFSSTDLKGPKSISTFLTKISELTPPLVIRQMTLLANLLDSESYTLRCALIEVCGNLIIMLSKLSQDDRSENHKAQIRIFFDVLEDRFLDINPYCRARVMQVYIRLCDLDQKYTKRRQKVAELAARSLEDKSSNVRRNAVKLPLTVDYYRAKIGHGGWTMSTLRSTPYNLRKSFESVRLVTRL